jgi:PmbA protein
LRVISDHRQAFASSSDLNDASILRTIDKAIDMVKVSPADPFNDLPEDHLFVKDVQDLQLCSASLPTVERLMEDALEIEDIALSVAGITNSHGASCNYSKSNIYFANSKGLNLTSSSSSFSKSIACIASDEKSMEYDYAYSISRNYNKLQSNNIIANEAATRANSRLGAQKLNSTKMAIIFSPRVARSFVSTFASLSTGQNFVLGTSFLKDYLGKQLFSSSVNLIDDPHVIGGLGSAPFDSEGVANQKMSIVKNGVFEVCMLDCYHAKKLSMQTTGHAKRGLSSPTYPGPTNFYLENGTIALEDMLHLENEVIVIDHVFSSNLNSLNGDISQGFSGAYYKKGQFQFPVSEVSYAGNLLDFYRELIAANDLKMEHAINAPSIFIPNVTIAGK